MAENTKPLEQCVNNLQASITQSLSKAKETSNISDEDLQQNLQTDDDVLISSFVETDTDLFVDSTTEIEQILKDSLPKLAQKSATYLLEFLDDYQYNKNIGKFKEPLTTTVLP